MHLQIAGQFQQGGNTDGFIRAGGLAGHIGRALVESLHHHELLAKFSIAAGHQTVDIVSQDILPRDL